MQKAVVIVVGMRKLPLHEELVRTLREKGVEVLDLDSYEEVPAALRQHRKAAIVVHSQHRNNGAHHVLRGLWAVMRNAPVLVVVNHTDLGEYYELMSEGALGYYEVAEGPRRISAAVESIAMRSAA